MADVDVTFGATLDDLLSSMISAKNAVVDFGETLAAAFAIREIASFVTSMAELGLQTERTMATLGVSAAVVGELSGMAALTGSDINSLALGIERFSLNVQRSTRDGINPMAQALRGLGLSARELVGVSADVYIQRLADAANKFAPSLNLTNLLMETGGRQAAQLVATLRLLGESWADNQAKIAATGSVLDDLQARGLAQTHENITLLGLSMQGLGVSVLEVFKPAIDAVVTSLTQFVQWLTNSIRGGGLMTDMMTVLGNAAKVLASEFIVVMGAIRALIVVMETEFRLAIDVWHTLELAVNAVSEALRNFVQWITDTINQSTILRTVFEGLSAAIDLVSRGVKAATDTVTPYLEAPAAAVKSAIGNLGDYKKTFEDTFNAFKSIAVDTGQEIQRVWQPTTEALKAGLGGAAAPAIDVSAAEKMQAAIASIAADIKAAEDRYSTLKRIYADDAASHQISELQKYQMTVSALNQEWAAVQGFYAKEEAAAAGSPAALGKVLAQQKEAYQKYYDELAKLAADYRKKNVEEWNKIGTEIQSAWDSQLRGLLAGTTTWAQAMKNVAADLVLMIIKEFEKLLIIQPLMAALGAFLPAPSSLFGGLGGLFGGPKLAAGGLYQEGTTYVPQTGLAMLHAGEAVVPASMNPSNPTATSPIGGSSSLSFNINAIDSRSFAAALMDPGSGLNIALRTMLRQNPGMLNTAAQRYV